MVQRQPFLSAFPGYHAFPGGKIDAADSEGIALPAFCGGFEPRLLRSLLREIIEELSVDLSQEPDVRIRPLGIALTPQKLPVRFKTHFFAIELSRSEEHTSELQSLMRISYAVFCLQKKTINTTNQKL